MNHVTNPGRDVSRPYMKNGSIEDPPVSSPLGRPRPDRAPMARSLGARSSELLVVSVWDNETSSSWQNALQP